MKKDIAITVYARYTNIADVDIYKAIKVVFKIN